jgi:hypothetical protein
MNSQHRKQLHALCTKWVKVTDVELSKHHSAEHAQACLLQVFMNIPTVVGNKDYRTISVPLQISKIHAQSNSVQQNPSPEVRQESLRV